MNSRNPTARQVRYLLCDVCGMTDYLTALLSRMQHLHLPDDDPLWREADATRIGMQRPLHAAQSAGQSPKKPLREE